MSDPLSRAHRENVAPVPPSIAALRQSMTALIEESQGLRADVKTAEQSRRRANQINLGVLGAVAIFTLLLLGLGWQNNRLAEKVNTTNSTMADCTTPGGSCYEEGRKRTSEAISDIVQVSIYMAECSRLRPGESGPAFDRALEQCVAARLAANRNAPVTPTPAPAPSASPVK